MSSNVMPDMRASYIEDWRITGPDEFNNFSPTGDPANDWWPTLMRAQTAVLGLNPQDGVPFQDNPPATIYLGKSTNTYPILRTVPVFCNLIGLRPYVRLTFSGPLVEDCLVAHYPDTPAVPSGFNDGTFHPTNGYAIGPGMAPWEGYGVNGFVEIRNLEINCAGDLGPNVRGIVIYRKIRVQECFIRSAPWHGVHVFADVLDTSTSNSNGTTLKYVWAYNCGKRSGTLARLVDPVINPTGFRGYGWGIKIQGGDGNIIITEGCDLTACGRGGIHDYGFLGPNTHILTHSEQISEPFLRTQLEADLETSSSAWIAANPPGGSLATSNPTEWARLNAIAQETLHSCRGWGQAVGSTNYWAVVLDSPSARSVALSTYAESDGILQVENTNVAVGGIVTRVLGTGMKVGVQAAQMNGTWRAQRNQGAFASVGFGLVDNTPMFLSSPSGANQRLEWRNGFYGGTEGAWLWSYEGGDLSAGLMIAGAASQFNGRTIRQGGHVFPLGVYVGGTQLVGLLTDPATTPPTVGIHEPGDLAFYKAGPKTPGAPLVWVCRLSGETLSWVPLLVMP